MNTPLLLVHLITESNGIHNGELQTDITLLKIIRLSS